VGTPRGGWLRSVAAGVVGVLAVLLLLVSAIAVWARVTLFDSDKVAALAGDALAEPEVTEALADRVSQEVFAAVDVEALLENVLPSSLDRLAPVMTGGLQAAVDRGLTEAFESPEVQDLVINLVRRAHSAAMRLLEGDGLVDGITVVDGAVTLNLLPLLDRGLTRLQSFGLLSDVDLPDLTADGDPQQQIAELESALGRDLPEDFGQLVVYQSDRLSDAQASVESAQRTLVLAKRALWVLLIATVFSIALTIVLARNRWRAAMLLGLGTVAAIVIARTGVRRVRDDAPELVERPGGKAALAAMLDGAASGLLRTFGLVLLAGAVVALIAFFVRDRQRSDLLLIAGIVAGAVVVGLLGLTIWSLLLGIVVGVAVPFVARQIWPARDATPPTPPTPTTPTAPA
jgi:hypothetical protein